MRHGGMPHTWLMGMAAMRAGVVLPTRANGKKRLAADVCAPLLELLARHPQLGGATGEVAMMACDDLLAQTEHLESYFARWRELQGLVHAVAREVIVQGPLPADVCGLVEGPPCDAQVSLCFDAPTSNAPTSPSLPEPCLGDASPCRYHDRRRLRGRCVTSPSRSSRS